MPLRSPGIPLVVLMFLVAGCGGAGGSEEAGVVIAQFRVESNGDVDQQSGDDAVGFDVPPGAVTVTTIITVDRLAARDLPEDVGSGLGLDPATEVLRFAADHDLLLPFTVRVRTEQDALDTGIDFGVFVPMILLPGNAPAGAGSPGMNASDASGHVDLVFRVDPAHVRTGAQEGAFYVITPTNLFVTVETTMEGQAVPPVVAVGEAVDTSITIACVEGEGLTAFGAGEVALDAAGWETGAATGGLIDFSGVPSEANCLYEFGDKPRRKPESGSTVSWSMRLPESTWNGSGGTPVISAEGMEILASTETDQAAPPAPTSIGDLPEADQIARSPGMMYWLARANDVALYVGCAPDLAIISADDEAVERGVVSNLTPNPTIGAVPLTTRTEWFSRASLAVAVPPVDALLFYGNSGYSIRHWVPEINDFGATEVDPNSGSVSDVDTYEEDRSRAVVVQSGRNQVRFVEFVTDPFPPFNARFTARDVFFKGIRSAQFPGATGFVVSAARRTDASPVYFVTVGATPDDPGKLWRMDTPTDISSQATLVGNVGNAPRRIRFMKTIGIVSNSFSDSLTILVRDAADNVTIKGTVDVGDGPIGVGLMELPNGNIGVASAGFLDNTYTVTILEPDGDVVSNVTKPVPNAGDKPACAVFANAEGTMVAVSCSGSDEVILITIG